MNTEFRGDSLVVNFRKPFDALAESIEAKNEKGAASDESSDAYPVWLREVVRSRNWVGAEAALDLRVERRLRLQREPRVNVASVPRPRTSVLARALEWQAMIRQPGIGNRAGLAAKLGVSRARITQGMAVLAAPPEVLEAVRRMEAAGRPLTERLWRRVAEMPAREAVRALGGQ